MSAAVYIPEHLLNDKSLTARQVADLVGVSRAVVQKRRQGFGLSSGPALVFPPEPPSRYAAPCSGCEGFSYVQVMPGRFCVCGWCCGSGLRDVKGDREPGWCVRDSMEGAVETDSPYAATSRALRGDNGRRGAGGKWGVRQKAAYDLAVLGLPWQAVADGSSYCNANQARIAARKYAERQGLPMPARQRESLSARAAGSSPAASLADAPRAAPTIQGRGALAGARGATS